MGRSVLNLYTCGLNICDRQWKLFIYFFFKTWFVVKNKWKMFYILIMAISIKILFFTL